MSIKGRWINGILHFFESTTHETVLPVAGFSMYDDFEGTVIATTAAGVKGWTVKDTANATETIVANQPGGVLSLALTADAVKQEAGIYLGDALNFNIDKGPIFEARVAVQVVPTDQAELYFGLANAYVEGPIAEADAGPTVHAFFCFDGSAVAKLFTDDASTDTDATSSGVTVVAEAYHIFRIDMSDASSVRFYIDGEQVGAATTHVMTNGTNVVLQPFIMAHKEAGAGLGTLYVDYVRVWQRR